MRESAIKQLSEKVNRFSLYLPFSEAIRSCLDTEILPRRKDFPRRFTEKDIPYNRYYGSRVPIDPLLAELPNDDGQYERLMQSCFWKGIGSPESALHEPELYVTGPVGSGKSTFVDYYLRHFCPEKGDYPKEFDKKLVVYFDARGLEYQAYASHAFFDRLQSAIEVHCKEHNVTLNLSPSRNSISRSQEALNILSDYCMASPDYKYLVVVLDNLDNCTVSVQRQLIQYVNDIRNYTDIELYRVIIPLWPTTYDTFSQSTEALTAGKPRIHLGPPLEAEFIEKRLTVIKDRVIEETRLFEGPSSDRPSPGEYADFIDFVDFVFKCLQSEELGTLIRDLSSGDLRRELWLWEGVLRSTAAQSVWDAYKENPRRKYEYEWMESLIAGDLRTRSGHAGRIANLFAIHHDHITPRDLLAGFHGCFLLKDCQHRRDWYTSMVRLGYSEEHLTGLEAAFRRYNLLHPVPEKFTGENFEVHERTVDAYIDLATNVTYVDNMAMVTPVNHNVQQQISITSGHTTRDLQRRVESSIAFIEFIQSQEIEFMKSIKANIGDNSERFVTELSWIHTKSIPRLSHGMADKYIQRANALRNIVLLDKQTWWGECESRLRNVVESTSQDLR